MNIKNHPKKNYKILKLIKTIMIHKFKKIKVKKSILLTQTKINIFFNKMIFHKFI